MDLVNILSTLKTKKEIIEYAEKLGLVVKKDNDLEKTRYETMIQFSQKYNTKRIVVYLEKHCIFEDNVIYKGNDGLFYLANGTLAIVYIIKNFQ